MDVMQWLVQDVLWFLNSQVELKLCSRKQGIKNGVLVFEENRVGFYLRFVSLVWSLFFGVLITNCFARNDSRL